MQSRASKQPTTKVRNGNSDGSVTPQLLAQAATLAAIAKVTSIQFALDSYLVLRDELSEKEERRNELTSQVRKHDELRVKFAKAEDYVAAQEHKVAKEEMQKELDEFLPELAVQKELCDAAQARHLALFLADEHAPFNRSEKITVCRQLVINPVTGNFDSVCYLSSDDDVQVNLDGKQFDSEAYNLEGWAAMHSFVVRRSTQDVEF